MLRLLIEDDSKILLEVVSDGEARYTITGANLRDNVGSYQTDDDMHVTGLVLWMLGAMNSREYLLRRLNERDRQKGE